MKEKWIAESVKNTLRNIKIRENDKELSDW